MLRSICFKYLVTEVISITLFIYWKISLFLGFFVFVFRVAWYWTGRTPIWLNSMPPPPEWATSLPVPPGCAPLAVIRPQSRAIMLQYLEWETRCHTLICRKVYAQHRPLAGCCTIGLRSVASAYWASCSLPWRSWCKWCCHFKGWTLIGQEAVSLSFCK